MNVIIYQNPNIVLYFSYVTFEFYKQTSITDVTEISYQELIEFIKIMTDISEANKWLLIIKAGKLAGIISEVA